MRDAIKNRKYDVCNDREGVGFMSLRYAIGVDIGGTKIATTIIDQHYDIHYRKEVPSVTTNAESMFTQVVNCIEALVDESSMDINDFEGMGVGVPGKVDQEAGIAVFQNNIPWPNFPLVKRLQDYFSIENVFIDNDVYMATLAEWQVHGGSIEETFVYLTISTGISCAIIDKGSFIRGAGFAGEMGLLPVKAPLHPDAIAGFEKVAAGPAIQKMGQDRQWTTEDVLNFYQKKDPEAIKIMNSVIASIAHSVYAMICMIDPHKIVFGGGVMNNHPYLIEKVKEQLTPYLVGEQKGSLDRLYVSHNKGDAGIIGAAFKVFQK